MKSPLHRAAGVGLLAVTISTPWALSHTTAHAADATSCSYTVRAGDNIANVVQAQPAGATICFPDGNWDVKQTIQPKEGQRLVGTGRSVLEGADRLRGWSREGNTWFIAGKLGANAKAEGVCEADGSDLCQYREDLFDGWNGLTRVASRDKVTAGKYFADHSANRLYVGSDPSQHNYTLAKTHTAIQSAASNVEIRGMVVQQFANSAQRGAIQVDGANWVVSNSRVVKNHGAGIVISRVSGARILNSEIAENGQIGVSGHNARGAVIDGNNVHDNNTSGFWIGDWESGGIKLTGSSATLRNNRVTTNKGPGVWIDVFCDGVTVEKNSILNNYSDGVRYEISRNGRILGNTIQGNAFRVGRGGGTSVWAGGGIVVNTGANVEVAENQLERNQHGISVQYRNRGSAPWGELKLEQVRVHSNSIDLTNTNAQVGSIGEQPYWNALYSGQAVSFDGNHYTVAAGSSERFTTRYLTSSFAAWQNAGFDRNGTLSEK